MRLERYTPVPLLHRKRYAKYKAGMSMEAIAAEAGVSVAAIEQSIRRVEMQQQLFSLAVMEERMIEDILDMAPIEKQALTEALKAEKLVISDSDGSKGEVIATEPDHETRLQASAAITEKQKAIYGSRSKGIGINVNTNVGVGVNAESGEAGFESMLRDIQKRRRVEVISQSALPEGGPTLEVVPEPEKLTVDGGS